MEIDRRNLLTAFATSTAAAILPALPVSAIVTEASRFYFPNRMIISTLPHPPPHGPPELSVLGDLWHFDPAHEDLWLIRHVPTGLTFRRAAQDHDRYALEAVCIDADNADWPKAAITLVGLAARYVALHARLVASCRWHKGAVFFRYTLEDPDHPYHHSHTEDAPPLSPFSSSGPPRGNRTVLPSDLTGFFAA